MEKTNIKKEYAVLLLSAVTVAVLCGGIGALFAYTLKTANSLFLKYNWLLFLLPVGGLLSVWLCNILKVNGQNTSTVFMAAKGQGKVSPLLSVVAFLGTTITQLFGGSAGKEGASLQIGGSVTSPIAKLFKIKDENSNILLLCGMTAVFSAVFMLPLAALAFALEIVFISRKFYFKAIVPLAASSYIAYYVSNFLGTKHEKFSIGKLPKLGFNNILKVLAVIVICSAGCLAFCLAIKYTETLFEKLFKNRYLRVAVGGALIILLTLLVKNRDYNGGGMHIIEYVLHGGQTVVYAFALKILFTAVTDASGFKGGEIIPALFIGATLGATVGGLIGLPTVFCAALGMVVLYGGGTKCMVSALFLGLEMFGISAFWYFLLAIMIAQMLTLNIGIFHKNEKKG